MATSPVDSTSSSRNDVFTPPPHPARSRTTNTVEDRIDSGFRSLKSYSRRHRRSAHSVDGFGTLGEEKERERERPYLEYVRQLVGAGWINLEDLAEYLGSVDVDVDSEGLVVSVLDSVVDEGAVDLKRWPDVFTVADLGGFMDKEKKAEGGVRWYLAEYNDVPSAALMETLGSGLRLDPRFWQWSIHSKGHVFTPSQRHRAPYVSLGFGVLNTRTPNKTDAERFKVLVYVQPDEVGDGWTVVILFSTHTKITMSPRILTDPPKFHTQIPPPITSEPKSFREIYIQSLSLLSLPSVLLSPFYATNTLLRMNCFLWNQIISTIKEEDKRLGTISDTSIGHAEEIKKSLHVVQRGGSFGWKGGEEQKAKERRKALEEDFTHLVEQTDILWLNRDKMTAIRQRNSETRWTSLTNAFTYIFAPVTIVSGIYGMNVSQISGSSSNPNIWQFFVTVVALNVLVVLALSISNWVHIQWNHGRAAGLKEVLGFAVGRLGSQD